MASVCSQVDMDGDQSVSRDELLPALALWKEIAGKKQSTRTAPPEEKGATRASSKGSKGGAPAGAPAATNTKSRACVLQ